MMEQSAVVWRPSIVWKSNSCLASWESTLSFFFPQNFLKANWEAITAQHLINFHISIANKFLFFCSGGTLWAICSLSQKIGSLNLAREEGYSISLLLPSLYENKCFIKVLKIISQVREGETQFQCSKCFNQFSLSLFSLLSHYSGISFITLKK